MSCLSVKQDNLFSVVFHKIKSNVGSVLPVTPRERGSSARRSAHPAAGGKGRGWWASATPRPFPMQQSHVEWRRDGEER